MQIEIDFSVLDGAINPVSEKLLVIIPKCRSAKAIKHEQSYRLGCFYSFVLTADTELSLAIASIQLKFQSFHPFVSIKFIICFLSFYMFIILIQSTAWAQARHLLAMKVNRSFSAPLASTAMKHLMLIYIHFLHHNVLVLGTLWCHSPTVFFACEKSCGSCQFTLITEFSVLATDLSTLRILLLTSCHFTFDRNCLNFRFKIIKTNSGKKPDYILHPQREVSI